MKKLILAYVVLLSIPISAQNIPRLSFEQLEPWLHQNNDTTYVINFWATWCGPCVKELPHLENIHYKAVKEKQTTKVVLVSLDFPEHYASKLVPFVLEQGLLSQVLFLDDGKANQWMPKVDPSWSGAIPATLIYHGKKRKFIEGPITEDIINQEINKLSSH